MSKMAWEAARDFLQPLLTTATPPFTRVDDALSLNPAPDQQGTLPVLLIHPWTDQAGENRYDNFVSQGVHERFALVIACARGDLAARRQQIFDALLGQKLPEHEYETTYVEGKVLDISATAIAWRDIFQTQLDREQVRP